VQAAVAGLQITSSKPKKGFVHGGDEADGLRVLAASAQEHERQPAVRHVAPESRLAERAAHTLLAVLRDGLMQTIGSVNLIEEAVEAEKDQTTLGVEQSVDLRSKERVAGDFGDQCHDHLDHPDLDDVVARVDVRRVRERMSSFTLVGTAGGSYIGVFRLLERADCSDHDLRDTVVDVPENVVLVTLYRQPGDVVGQKPRERGLTSRAVLVGLADLVQFINQLFSIQEFPPSNEVMYGTTPKLIYKDSVLTMIMT